MPVEYPFFESVKKWCSYRPDKTHNLYGIDAAQLQVGRSGLL